jgi:hypothetical protein
MPLEYVVVFSSTEVIVAAAAVWLAVLRRCPYGASRLVPPLSPNNELSATLSLSNHCIQMNVREVFNFRPALSTPSSTEDLVGAERREITYYSRSR